MEAAEPILAIGTGPHDWPHLDILNRELAAISMSVPQDIASLLRDERRRHPGELGESQEYVESRRRIVRKSVFQSESGGHARA